MRAYKLISLASALTASLALSACDVTTPSQITTEKIRVKNQVVTQTLEAGQMDPGRLNAIAEDFLRKASPDGKMTLTVSYLAGDRGGEAAAARHGSAYKKAFGQLGVPSISVVTVPMTGKQYAGKVIVAYKALSALPPEDCRTMPGSQGAESRDVADRYPFGCGTKTAISRMVADPSDLLGKGGTQDIDSRRTGAVVDPYVAGKPPKPLKGFQASDIGSGG